MSTLRALLLTCATILPLSLTACVSIDPGADSDIPWNQPQEWEGRPGIPGLDQQ